jgi:hypothetical protein
LGAGAGKDLIEGFSRRDPLGTISVHEHNGECSNNLVAPKLMACVAGIESGRYDFERFLPLKKYERRDAVKRHLVTFFLGKKVT